MSINAAPQMIIGFLFLGLFLMLLVFVVLIARKLIRSSGFARIVINGAPPVPAPLGQKLLSALADNGVHLPAACGGKGSCGQCQVKITRGNDAILPVEKSHINPQQAAMGIRLACMVAIRKNLYVQVPTSLIETQRRLCHVVSNNLVSTFMTHLELIPADGFSLDFQAGDYILVEASPGKIAFKDFSIPDKYLADWSKFRLRSMQTVSDKTEFRAYSLANTPLENRTIELLVRIATPPANAPKGTPAGKVSSFLFSLKQGDPVYITGPFGDFHIRENDREMVFIGGGAGMAPIRAMIREQLLRVKTHRKISFWYGARSKQQLCYENEFEQLALEHKNFNWQVALSEPQKEDNWTGLVGFIHSIAFQHYLSKHPRPDDIDYYLCGPPMMTAAVTTMLIKLGVKEDHIFNDDFGAG